MHKPRYIVISIFLHILVPMLFMFAAAGTGSGKGKSHGEALEGSRYQGVKVGTVLEKEKVEITVIESEHTPGIKKKHKKKIAVKDCPATWYGGIGLQSGFDMSLNREVIQRVFPGYPADNAGLVPGDIIEEVIGEEILGPPGTILQLRINHRGVSSIISIVRGKICY